MASNQAGLVSRLRDRRFNGYLGVKLPHPLDAEVEAVVLAYMGGTAAGREGMLDAVGDRTAGVLSAYGQRMASMAVRTGALTDLRRGVVGVGMAEGRLQDYRDNLFVLSAINDSASLIGTSLGKVIDGLKDLLPPAGLAALRAFDRRVERDKSLEAFGLGRSGTGESFLYV
ncbi:hypothetical protein [Streptomyces sp. NPDC046909]|uniref:hypothetical protein n=1 Tax=Streptomyces sp. NPDC046909 TaxID=3155617 RepID=UPI0033C4DA07